jgi:hypothetical protein
MTSARKIAANRRNSRKSCGPRTAAGKAIASRNALRHGWASRAEVCLEHSPEIDRLAKALCGDNNDRSLFEQALVIARNQQVLRAIAAQRIGVIERLRDPRSIALAKGDNSLKLATAIAARLKDPAFDDYHAVCERSAKRDPTGPRVAHEWTEDLEAASKLIKQRDEYQAVEEATPDLLRLERYYRQVWVQQRRAIQQFMNTKLSLSLERSQDGGSLPARSL